MSSAVATLVAIWQNASCGVRMFIACQLRLSTSTMVLFKMSDINVAHQDRSARLSVCSSLKWQEWLPRQESHPDLRFQRPAHCWLCNEAMACQAVALAKAGRSGRFCPLDFWV